MKHLFSLAALLLAASLSSAPVSVTNGKVKLTWNNGTMRFSNADGSAAVSFVPADAQGRPQKFVTAIIAKPKRGKAISLRSENCAVTFLLDLNRPAMTVATPYNVSVTVKAPTEAIVIPDEFAEDIILEPGNSARNMPRFVPYFMGLLDGGKATLGCIPFRHKTDIKLSPDLKSWTIRPERLDEFTFVLNTGNGIWYKQVCSMPAGSQTTLPWRAPFPARWRLAMPVQKDFVPAGNNLHSTWNIVTVLKEKPATVRHRPPRVTISDGKTLSTWISGFDRFPTYPAAFDAEGRVRFKPLAYKNPDLTLDRGKNLYIYAYAPADNDKAPAPLPEALLEPDAREAAKSYRSRSIGIGPATCHITSNVIEKMFYRGEARSKRAELEGQMAQMQNFVESIRSRIESYREWGKELLKRAAVAQRTAPNLASAVAQLRQYAAEFDRLYNIELPKMKQPADAFKLQRALLKELDNSALDNEALEEKAKAFGRATRTIGGAQDRLVAEMRHVAKCIRQRLVLDYMKAKTEEERRFFAEAFASTTTLMQDFYDHEGK